MELPQRSAMTFTGRELSRGRSWTIQNTILDWSLFTPANYCTCRMNLLRLDAARFTRKSMKYKTTFEVSNTLACTLLNNSVK